MSHAAAAISGRKHSLAPATVGLSGPRAARAARLLAASVGTVALAAFVHVVLYGIVWIILGAVSPTAPGVSLTDSLAVAAWYAIPALLFAVQFAVVAGVVLGPVLWPAMLAIGFHTPLPRMFWRILLGMGLASLMGTTLDAAVFAQWPERLEHPALLIGVIGHLALPVAGYFLGCLWARRSWTRWSEIAGEAAEPRIAHHAPARDHVCPTCSQPVHAPPTNPVDE